MERLPVLLLLILTVSCNNENKSQVRNFSDSVEYNLGVVTNDIVLREFVVRKEWVNRKIKSITSTCGCTVVELDKYQPLIEGKLFKVRVSLENKQPGIGRQSITISFDDGLEFSATLIYEYMPFPSVRPQYLVLRKNEKRAILEFQFPGELDIIIKRIQCPEFIRCAEKRDRLEPNKITLEVECSDSPIKRSEGTIICETSSTRRPVISVQLLVLEN
jgi:hypothetical protein